MNLSDAIGQAWPGIGPAVGIALGWYLSQRSQREGWAREDRYRHRAEKVAAYGAFLAASGAKIEWLIGTMNLVQVGSSRDEEPGTPDPDVPLQTILILAPTVAEAAQGLYDFSVSFGLNVLQRQLQNMQIDTEREIPDFDASKYNSIRDRVVKAMREDLK